MYTCTIAQSPRRSCSIMSTTTLLAHTLSLTIRLSWRYFLMFLRLNKTERAADTVYGMFCFIPPIALLRFESLWSRLLCPAMIHRSEWDLSMEKAWPIGDRRDGSVHNLGLLHHGPGPDLCR